MANVYVLFKGDALIGVFESGKGLSAMTALMAEKTKNECLVKTVPKNRMSTTLAGHDYQGTSLNEWLHTPASKEGL